MNSLVNVAFFVPLQVQRDLEECAQHGVGLVFFCELHEAHHHLVRSRLPRDWTMIGRDEFLIAMAPGWQLHGEELRHVWPQATERRKSWRKYYQAVRDGMRDEMRDERGERGEERGERREERGERREVRGERREV